MKMYKCIATEMLAGRKKQTKNTLSNVGSNY